MTPHTGVFTLPAACAELAASIGVLSQCEELVAKLDAETFTAPARVIAGSTIGQHVRHLIDHFDAVVASPATGLIDYDHRERNTPVEREPAAAVARLRTLADHLASLGPADLAARVRVRVMLADSGECAECGSTFGRELAFAGHHAVHHHAMIAAIARERGLEVPAGFGKAPSTLHHERGDGARA